MDGRRDRLRSLRRHDGGDDWRCVRPHAIGEILIIGEVARSADIRVATGVHMHGVGFGANDVTLSNLRVIARHFSASSDMTISWFGEEFERRGLIQAGSPVVSRLRAVLVLRPGDVLADVKVILAVMALVRRGLSVRKAKRFVEDVLDRGRAVLSIPSVDSEAALARELETSGFKAVFMSAVAVDVRAVRDRLSQEQFAARFGLEIDSVQNWESGRRQPDGATQSHLRVIDVIPDQVSVALECADRVHRSTSTCGVSCIGP